VEAGDVIDFAEPGWLLLLAVVAAMALAGVRLARWRLRAQESFAGPQAQRWPVAPAWPRLALVVIAALLIVVAAARPQWGSREMTRDTQGIDLVVVLDVSQSMQATDVAPSRIAVAEDQLARLAESMRGSRVGLVLFAGNAILRSPLTSDTLALAELIRRAHRDAGLAATGSGIAAALEQAAKVLEDSETPGKAVIVVSDGEDHIGGYPEKARALREKGIPVYTAGVGTTQGAGLVDTDPRTGRTTPKLDANRRPVVTHLEEASLQTIASEGGGSYVRMSAGAGLSPMRDQLARLEQSPLRSESSSAPIERFQAFIVAALILLVEAWLVPTRFLVPARARLRRARPYPGLAVVLLLALAIGGCGGDSLRERNAAANRLYDEGSYQEALEAYQALLAQRPDVPELSVNAGNALHRLESYERAVAETRRALPPTDDALGAVTYYNLGDHLLALDQLEPAYDAFKSSLLLDPGDVDAKHNLEVTLARLAERQRGQPPPGQQDNQSQPGQQQPPPSGQQPTEAPSPTANQPAPSEQPVPTGSPGPANPSRELQDALRGIEDELTFEEAVRILDLLRRQQESQRPGTGSNRGPGPDY
jgi:Ca-activated chloride channel family protein